jgi:hypothetical protein
LEVSGDSRGNFLAKEMRLRGDGQRAVQIVSLDSSTLLALQGAEANK